MFVSPQTYTVRPVLCKTFKNSENMSVNLFRCPTISFGTLYILHTIYFFEFGVLCLISIVKFSHINPYSELLLLCVKSLILSTFSILYSKSSRKYMIKPPCAAQYFPFEIRLYPSN